MSAPPAPPDRPPAGEAVWPEGNRSCVSLAFDLDGPTGSAMVDGSIWHMPRYFVQGAYGPYRAVPRLLDLLERSGVRATFYVPAWVVEHFPDRCRAIVAGGHEVAHHGYRHERYLDLSVDEQEAVLRRSQQVFEEVLGARAVGYRTPTGDWAAETPRLLVEHGFAYSSSLRDDDRPYLHVIGGATTSLVEIPAPVELDDYAYFAYTEDPPFPKGHDRIAPYRLALSNWCAEFDGSHSVGGCLTTTFHPKVSATPGRALVVEAFIEHMRSAGRCWFATGAEVARWVLDHPDTFARAAPPWDPGARAGVAGGVAR